MADSDEESLLVVEFSYVRKLPGVAIAIHRPDWMTAAKLGLKIS